MHPKSMKNNCQQHGNEKALQVDMNQLYSRQKIPLIYTVKKNYRFQDPQKGMYPKSMKNNYQQHGNENETIFNRNSTVQETNICNKNYQCRSQKQNQSDKLHQNNTQSVKKFM